MSRQIQSASRLGDYLVKSGRINEEQRLLGLKMQKMLDDSQRSLPLGEILARLGFISRAEVDLALQAMGARLEGYTDIHLPSHILRRHQVVVLGMQESRLIVEAAQTLNEKAREEILLAARNLGLSPDSVEVRIQDRLKILRQLNNLRAVDQESMTLDIARFCQDETNGLLLQQIVENLVADAMRSRASDIHINRSMEALSCWVAYRIDGELYRRYAFTETGIASLATRIKTLARMDASETRRAQDGRMSRSIDGREVDCRVASIPTDDGEALTIRLLDPSSRHSLDYLFNAFPDIHVRLLALSRVRQKSGGMVVMSGPTGSGKSTTMLGLVAEMDRYHLNIMTAEDPVEIRIPFVRQTGVNRATGMDYPAILRAMLRQDPDVIVVGEMRDPETAEIALRAVESGHLLLSTVHTSTVWQSLSRLLGLLPESYRSIGTLVLADNLKAVVNQRLARRLCRCAAPRGRVSEREREILVKLHLPEDLVLLEATGCPFCDHTGYYGRTLAPEALFLPSHAAGREAIQSIMVRQPFRPQALLEVPNALYFSREQSVSELLMRQLIDLETALAVLDVDQLSEEVL